MSAPLNLLRALGPGELYLLFWLTIVMDFPRYFLSAFVVAIAPGRYPQAETNFTVSAVIACYNEDAALPACVEALRAAGVDEIIVVDDGSEDATGLMAIQLGVILLSNALRQSKPISVNLALRHCTGDLILIADADTTLEPDALAKAKPYLLDPKVGGVGFNLRVRNADATLTTRLQAIEYAIVFTAGRMFSDAFGILPNISGAAGLFRRTALDSVEGLDVEVAEDAALAMKLRRASWKLRYAGNACAWTMVPEEPAGLVLQRIRWDASIITIYWRKFGNMVNPFARDLKWLNLLIGLDVLVFSVLMQAIFPVYLWWLWNKVGVGALILLGAVMIGLALVDIVILLLVRLPPWLIAYVPLYLVVQMVVMRPLRVLAMTAELLFSITHFDNYIPKQQRWRLT